MHKPVPPDVVAFGKQNSRAEAVVSECDPVSAAPSWLDWLWMHFFAPQGKPLGIRCVLISDTHGCHRQIQLPEGDVLIHGGDFTRSGLLDDAEDFNNWLGEQPHAHKLVVFGNHEYNASWKDNATRILSNAILLRDNAVTLEVHAFSRTSGHGSTTAAQLQPQQLRVHGTNFCWPMRSRNPIYDQIGGDAIDVLVAHGPVAGYSDGGKGCNELLRLARRLRPRLVVGGHIHYAHGTAQGRERALAATTFVNASNAREHHNHMGWLPVVIDV